MLSNFMAFMLSLQALKPTPRTLNPKCECAWSTSTILVPHILPVVPNPQISPSIATPAKARSIVGAVMSRIGLGVHCNRMIEEL